jgi:methylated-DNA-protein-cysteine methyltransferase-like protein
MTFNDRVYVIVQAIPRGKVLTYGAIAKMLGVTNAAREVGWALATCNPEIVPWQRVINAQGKISPRGRSQSETIQRELLEAEGVAFDANAAVNLEVYLWQPSPIEVRVILENGFSTLVD